MCVHTYIYKEIDIKELANMMVRASLKFVRLASKLDTQQELTM